MPDVVKHAWTHRPKGRGGTDPIPFELPYCYGSDNAAGQSVTATSELTFSVGPTLVRTNDSSVFRFDTSDPEGILVIKDGVYRITTSVIYNASNILVQREAYPTVQLLSAGPLAGVGAPFGSSSTGRIAEIGLNGGEYSLASVTSTSTAKSQLSYVGIAPIFGSTSGPFRAAVILSHPAGDYSLNAGLNSTMMIERIGDIWAGVAPPP